jgi:phosphomevalonate kinase
MIARSPGKVVLSGAYAVLCGAPAIVAAVDRYAIADTAKPPTRTTPEIEAALARRAGRSRSPMVDATALRSQEGEDRKLGLGSSAAMLVAALAALELADAPDLGTDSLRQRIFDPALQAHRSAQGGGSGIDVVASTFGEVRRCQVATGGSIDHETWKLPAAIVVEIWSSRESASTRDMLARFWALRENRPSAFRDVVRDLSLGAEVAAGTCDAARFIDACRTQQSALSRLGTLAGSPIVTPAAEHWNRIARPKGAVVLPSGAGGGDIVLWIGTATPDAHCFAAAAEAGLTQLSMGIGAEGVHCASFEAGQ